MTNVCGSVRGGSTLPKSLIYSSTSCPDTKIISRMPKSLERKREEKLCLAGIDQLFAHKSHEAFNSSELLRYGAGSSRLFIERLLRGGCLRNDISINGKLS